MNPRHLFKLFAKYVLTFLGVILFFNLSLYLACLFSSDRLYRHACESSATITQQEAFPWLCYPLDVKNDNNMDAYVINELFSVDCTRPFESYMKVRKNYREGLTTAQLCENVGEFSCVVIDPNTGQERCGIDTKDTPPMFSTIDELRYFLDQQIHTSINYGRYWHGYIPLFRLMLVFFNITQMRLFLLGMFIVLYGLVLALIYKRFGRTVAAIFGASLLCSGYFTAHFSLQGAHVFLVLMVGAVYLLWRLDKLRDFGLFIFVIGCFVNFVDYLTVPLVTLGVLSAIYLLKLLDEGREWDYCVKSLLQWSCLWVLGYGLTWLAKWAQYDLTIHESQSMISIGLQQCLVRMSRTDNLGSPFGHNYFRVTLYVMGKSSLFTLFTAGLLLAWNHWLFCLRGFNKKALPFLILSIYPIIWFLVLANHILFHYYFAYRTFVIYMLGILLALHTLNAGSEPTKNRCSGNNEAQNIS